MWVQLAIVLVIAVVIGDVAVTLLSDKRESNMIKINFEAQVYESTYMRMVFITGIGETPEDVIADAERQQKALRAVNMRAVGLKNTKEDWEAMYGKVTDESVAFADTFEEDTTPKKSWLRRLFGI